MTSTPAGQSLRSPWMNEHNATWRNLWVSRPFGIALWGEAQSTPAGCAEELTDSRFDGLTWRMQCMWVGGRMFRPPVGMHSTGWFAYLKDDPDYNEFGNKRANEPAYRSARQ